MADGCGFSARIMLRTEDVPARPQHGGRAMVALDGNKAKENLVPIERPIARGAAS